MFAGVSSTTRMRPSRGARNVLASACMALRRLLELGSGLVKGKGLDVLFELSERLSREPGTDQFTVGIEVIQRGGVPVGQILPQLIDSLLDCLGIAGRGRHGTRRGGLAIVGFQRALLHRRVEQSRRI